MLDQFAQLFVFGVAPLVVGLLAMPAAATADKDRSDCRNAAFHRLLDDLPGSAERSDQPTISVSENQ